MLIVGFSLLDFRLDSVGQLISAHETHITSTHYSQNSAPQTARSDGFLWTTTSSCCCNTRSSSSSSSSSSSTCCCNTRSSSNTAKYNVSTSSDNLAAASHATAAAVLLPGSTSTHRKHRCDSQSEDVPCRGLLHEIAPAVTSAGRTRAKTSCCLRRQDDKERRLYTHNGAKASIRYLHKASYYIIYPRRLARKASYVRSWFWRITTQVHPKNLVVVEVAHHIS